MSISIILLGIYTIGILLSIYTIGILLSIYAIGILVSIYTIGILVISDSTLLLLEKNRLQDKICNDYINIYIILIVAN